MPSSSFFREEYAGHNYSDNSAAVMRYRCACLLPAVRPSLIKRWAGDPQPVQRLLVHPVHTKARQALMILYVLARKMWGKKRPVNTLSRPGVEPWPMDSRFSALAKRPPTPIALLLPRSRELRTQKLKSHLLRTQSSHVLPLKPGVGQYITIHATLTARDFFRAYFYPFGPVTCICFQNLSRFFLALAVANTGSCVGPQNKIDHPAGCRFPC